ncbi:hypothetical protein MPSEU_000313100 [Mayamaea pseudoterrestris]|nr:hypothetical protein MPSEU_000313100 [Mayamaea pseudoterrestris]
MQTPPDHKITTDTNAKSHVRRNSWSSPASDDEGSLPPAPAAVHHSATAGDLPPPVLVYHASARSIVFRDQLRRAAQNHDNLTTRRSTMSDVPDTAAATFTHQNEVAIDVAGFVEKAQPLKPLELGAGDNFLPLLQQGPFDSKTPTNVSLTPAEQEVVTRLNEQRAVVKTIQNEDWTSFIHRFIETRSVTHGLHPSHFDQPPDGSQRPFNSFITSTTLLPSSGRKMRCYGSTTSYTVGVVFSLPDYDSQDEETVAAAQSMTWAWPAGYSAKTEFNRNSQGMLINGRQEALQPLSVLRKYNDDYLTKKEYMVGLRKVSGLNAIPYNEVFQRVGGFGRIVCGKDVVTGQKIKRTFEHGVGLPVALFVRTAHFGHLITMVRTRARLMHVLGEEHMKTVPLLYITPETGVRVLTDALQQELWKVASTNLNPFQNINIAHKTTIANTEEASFQQKVEELLDFDESIRSTLTPEELARLAGGFGATDYSVATILKELMENDRQENQEQVEGEAASHKLQDVVNEGMAAAVRSGDYHTSRQLLILYTLVASAQSSEQTHENKLLGNADTFDTTDNQSAVSPNSPKLSRSSSLGRDPAIMKKELELAVQGSHGEMIDFPAPPPPPPPLDTDRLRSATNSDGLLAVLGAAQVLRAMQDGSARTRAFEAVAAVEEWVNHGEQNMAFRISSWYDQKSAQGDLKIASENPSNFMAFVSGKAITNRRNFAEQLKTAVSNTDFNSFRFLKAIDAMLSKMHSPCLRLELLQYILGLDNRFSVAHVTRSVELAATCLGISQSSYMVNGDN